MYTFMGHEIDQDYPADSLADIANKVDLKLPVPVANVKVWQGLDEDGDPALAYCLEQRWYAIYWDREQDRWFGRFILGLSNDEFLDFTVDRWDDFNTITYQDEPPVTLEINDPFPGMAEFDGGGVRSSDDGKPMFDMLLVSHLEYDEQVLTRAALRMAEGAETYGARNFEKFADSDALERCKSSLLRHVFQYIAGETDEDHLAAVVCNAVILSSVEKRVRDDSEA